MRVTFDHTEDIASHIKTFWFSADKPAHNTAGQFIELFLPHDNPDERGIKRWFTLSSSPTEKLLSITTKLTEKTGSSFKTALQNLQPGDTLTMSEPMGDFVLPKDPSIPLIFVAGGIGVTPMRSMVKYLSDTDEKRNIHLLYAANRIEDVAFRSLFEDYGVSLDIILTSPPKGWAGATGHVTGQDILDATGDPAGKLLYLSGPEPMIENLFKDLRSRGLKETQLVTDYFPNYPAV